MPNSSAIDDLRLNFCGERPRRSDLAFALLVLASFLAICYNGFDFEELTIKPESEPPLLSTQFLAHILYLVSPVVGAFALFIWLKCLHCVLVLLYVSFHMLSNHVSYMTAREKQRMILQCSYAIISSVFFHFSINAVGGQPTWTYYIFDALPVSLFAMFTVGPTLQIVHFLIKSILHRFR